MMFGNSFFQRRNFFIVNTRKRFFPHKIPNQKPDNGAKQNQRYGNLKKHILKLVIRLKDNCIRGFII